MKTIQVKGVGTIRIPPDTIEIAMNLVTRNKDYETTLLQSEQELILVREALQAIGIDKDQVKTTNFNIVREVENTRDTNGNYKQVFKGYVCTHSLLLKIAFNTNRLGQVINALGSSTVDVEFTIRFTVSDRQVVINQLLVKAVEDARNKADVLAKASGVIVGDLETISYNWNDIEFYSPTSYQVDKRRLATPMALEIVPEEIQQSDSVSIVWNIRW